MLLANNESKEIAKERTVLDGSRKYRLRGKRSAPISDETPEIWPHQLQPTTDQCCQTLGCRWVSSMQNIVLVNSHLPFFLIEPL